MTALSARVGRISFRARLGYLTALAVGVTVALAALASYIAVSHQLYAQVDSSLHADLSNARQVSFGGGIDPNRVALFLRNNNSSFLQVIDADRTVTFSSVNGNPIPPTTAQAQLALSSRSSIRTVSYQGIRYRVITAGGYLNQNTIPATPAALQIGRPLTDVGHTLRDLRLILWLVTVGGVGMAIALGYVVGRTTMRPVARLTAAAEHVAVTQQLDATIAEDGDDELARLARSFNAMLSALAESRQQQAQLISDAGHELRTPLTSLRTNIEVLMRVPDLSEADRAEIVADVNAQLTELTTLIGDVVDVARDDEKASPPIEVRLDAIVMRAVERARRRAPNVVFETSITAGSVRAQPALLERAILNVLDNAAKWSPPGATVTVSLQRNHAWSLDIRDQGPGIAPQDAPFVFDRFYRAESARAMPGSGLGLAIVRKVISDHGGLVTAWSPPGGGTLVHIELPTVTEQEPDSVVIAEPAPAGDEAGPTGSSDSATPTTPTTPDASDGSGEDRGSDFQNASRGSSV